MAIFNSYVSSQRRHQATGNDTHFFFFRAWGGVGGDVNVPVNLLASCMLLELRGLGGVGGMLTSLWTCSRHVCFVNFGDSWVIYIYNITHWKSHLDTYIYICVYINMLCIHIHLFSLFYTYTCTYIVVYIYALNYISHLPTHTHPHIYLYIYICMYICMYVCIYIYVANVYIYIIYTYIYIYIYVYIYIHICTYV